MTPDDNVRQIFPKRDISAYSLPTEGRSLPLSNKLTVQEQSPIETRRQPLILDDMWQQQRPLPNVWQRQQFPSYAWQQHPANLLLSVENIVEKVLERNVGYPVLAKGLLHRGGEARIDESNVPNQQRIQELREQQTGEEEINDFTDSAANNRTQNDEYDVVKETPGKRRRYASLSRVRSNGYPRSTMSLIRNLLKRQVRPPAKVRRIFVYGQHVVTLNRHIYQS